jgi:hypothetical protein
MKFGTWNVRSLYILGSLKTATMELVKYKLQLMGLQVWWGMHDIEWVDVYTCLWEREYISFRDRTYPSYEERIC